jgi:AcrR family transcriptional regulator
LRREAILSAAASCFREHGYGVNLEVIAKRAGVGRATMQRNFADRETLALAVLSQEAEILKNNLDLSRPFYESLKVAVIQEMPTLAMYQHIAAELSRAETGRTALARLGDEVSAFLTPLVSVAKSRGEVSETISAHDFAIYMQMAASVLHVGMSDEEIDTNLDVAMRILTLGTQPR